MEIHCAKKLQKDCHSSRTYRANKITSNLKKKISIIKAKYLKASYPNWFIDSIINDFRQPKEDFLIPPSLFEQQKEISIQVPFGKRNEEKMKWIICILEGYTIYKISLGTHGKLEITIPFPLKALKDPIFHQSNAIYNRTCTCKEFYIRETKRN